MSNSKLPEFDFDLAAIRCHEPDLKNRVAKANGAVNRQRVMVDRIGMIAPVDHNLDPLQPRRSSPPLQV